MTNQDWASGSHLYLGRPARSFCQPGEQMTPLVASALSALHERIDYRCSFAHNARDQDAVYDILVRLHQAGEELDSEEIGKWAKRQGWSQVNVQHIAWAAMRAAEEHTLTFHAAWKSDILAILSSRGFRPEIPAESTERV
jgi:hypothetical protein